MLIQRGNTLKAHQHISYSVFVAVDSIEIKKSGSCFDAQQY